MTDIEEAIWWSGKHDKTDLLIMGKFILNKSFIYEESLIRYISTYRI